MIDHKLNNIDPDDISDILLKVEKSFDITFSRNELMNISTFGQLCNHIADKIQLNNTEDCTTQQAFYKLRSAISLIFNIENKAISTNASLSLILPKKSRIYQVRQLEKYLGIKLNILRPSSKVMGILFFALLASFIGLFINWQIGLLAILASISGIWFANKTGNELSLNTVGQLAKKMAREHYLKSRRNPETFSKDEIETILTDLFSNDLGLDKNKLTSEAKLV